MENKTFTQRIEELKKEIELLIRDRLELRKIGAKGQTLERHNLEELKETELKALQEGYDLAKAEIKPNAKTFWK